MLQELYVCFIRNYIYLINLTDVFYFLKFFGFTSLLIYLIDALIRTIKMKRGEIGFTIRRNPESSYDASKNNTQPTY